MLLPLESSPCALPLQNQHSYKIDPRFARHEQVASQAASPAASLSTRQVKPKPRPDLMVPKAWRARFEKGRGQQLCEVSEAGTMPGSRRPGLLHQIICLAQRCKQSPKPCINLRTLNQKLCLTVCESTRGILKTALPNCIRSASPKPRPRHQCFPLLFRQTRGVWEAALSRSHVEQCWAVAIPVLHLDMRSERLRQVN